MITVLRRLSLRELTLPVKLQVLHRCVILYCPNDFIAHVAIAHGTPLLLPLLIKQKHYILPRTGNGNVDVLEEKDDDEIIGTVGAGKLCRAKVII